MSSPILVVPWKNSTFVIVALVAEAVALIVMLPGGVNRWLLVGFVMITVGGEMKERVTGVEVNERQHVSVAVDVRL